MSEEQIVREGVNWNGIYQIHVVRMGEPPDAERCCGYMEEKVRQMGWGGLLDARVESKEEDMDVFHLWLFWRVDEASRERIWNEMVIFRPELAGMQIGGEPVRAWNWVGTSPAPTITEEL